MVNYAQEVYDADADGNQTPLSVSEFNTIIKGRVESDPRLTRVLVKGQVNNLRRYPTAAYFSISDLKTAIPCVLFASRLGHQYLEDGAEVRISGSVSYYLGSKNSASHPRPAELKLMADEVVPYGVGVKQKEFQVLKAALEAEGLFSKERKLSIPQIPKRVAVVTSENGAALQDILSVFEKRYPLLTVILVPVTVSGANAKESIISGLKRVVKTDADVCILARGGGKSEDLWVFNDEKIARTIFGSSVPIVTGIGHQTDETIADLVASARAPSPSAAAELVTPDSNELKDQFAKSLKRITFSVEKKFADLERDVETQAEQLISRGQFEIGLGQQKINGFLNRCNTAIKSAVIVLHTTKLNTQTMVLASKPPDIKGRLRHTSRIMERARNGMNNLQNNRKKRTDYFDARLKGLSPKNIMKRGYSIATLQNGTTIKDVAQVKIGDVVMLKLSRGKLQTKTFDKTDEKN